MPDLPATLSRLYARVPLGMRMGLGAMRGACAALGHPEGAFPSVHVAGTNGKGSVCAMVESIARAQGLRTGLYTSPHLCRFAERIRLDGEPVSDSTLAGLLDRALDPALDLSFFEAATMAALLAFREADVDVAVIEVGLGGRLDATNVLPAPRAAAITRIAFDHMDRLGSTLVEIAREKAGIAKPGLDIVVGPVDPEVRAAIDQVARAAGATTSDLSGVDPPPHVGLAGAHQLDNARIAAVLGARIGASPSAVARGIADVKWPGRLERVGSFLLDAAHNPDGAVALATHLASLGIRPRDVALVFGTLGDKDWTAMLDTLAPHADRRIYLAPRGAARNAVDPAAMAARRPGTVVESMAEALALVRSAPLAVVAGSLVLLGDARAQLLRLPRDPPVAL